MITLFTIPKPFVGSSNIIQRNAVQSWLKLPAKCEIILFGNEEGIGRTAKEFGVLHIPEIEKNEFGTPLLSSAFTLAQEKARHTLLVYINTDILLLSDFIKGVKQMNQPLFLMTGRRWDIAITEPLDFRQPHWESSLRQRIASEGKAHGLSGIDYLVFPRNLPHELPDFAVGRPGWDSWLLYHVRSLKIPLIDATEAVTVVHQNHDYSHSPWGRKERVEGPEFQHNVRLAGGFSQMLTLRDADWVLKKDGLRRPKFTRRIFAALSLLYPWRLLLSVKRRLQA